MVARTPYCLRGHPRAGETRYERACKPCNRLQRQRHTASATAVSNANKSWSHNGNPSIWCSLCGTGVFDIPAHEAWHAAGGGTKDFKLAVYEEWLEYPSSGVWSGYRFGKRSC